MREYRGLLQPTHIELLVCDVDFIKEREIVLWLLDLNGARILIDRDTPCVCVCVRTYEDAVSGRAGGASRAMSAILGLGGMGEVAVATVVKAKEEAKGQ